MYIKFSTGPSTEPWGIPLFTSCHENLESLVTTLCCRPERKSVIQFKVLQVTPYCLRTPISLLCGTESKAFLKSKYITSTFSCLSIALVKSSITFRSCKFSERPDRKPYCAFVISPFSLKRSIKCFRTNFSNNLQHIDVKLISL